mmetsp:Transcript_2831/g.5676  ORF Transcript_2831/g.5676 Transcript_2831/m.5676 type:complete len:531 (-) Transcript_2831:25-1617(-)
MMALRRVRAVSLDGGKRPKCQLKDKRMQSLFLALSIIFGVQLGLHYQAYHESHDHSNWIDLPMIPYVKNDGNSSLPTYHPTILGPSIRSFSPNTLPTLENADNFTINSSRRSTNNTHPRVVCYAESVRAARCKVQSVKNEKFTKQSIPNIQEKVQRRAKIEKEPEGNEGDVDYETDETDDCKYIYDKSKIQAQSTCNDIHSFGFDSGIFESNNIRPKMSYITSGGAKSVWKVNVTSFHSTTRNTEQFILKANKYAKFMKNFDLWEKSRQDAVVTSIAMSTSTGPNQILPLFGYCSLANIVPFAGAGTLNEFISNNERLDPLTTLKVALQVARGLLQSQLYTNGKASFVHGDINPTQYLVIQSKYPSIRHNSRSVDEKIGSEEETTPIILINDFNQGRFLTRSIVTNENCPFRVCNNNNRGGRYHSPEKFYDCTDQNDRVDTFSLGGVFYFLLSGGKDPYYYNRGQKYDISIRNGDLPLIALHKIKGRVTSHPAFIALKNIMYDCMAHKLNERPSVSDVVQVLEKEIEKLT